VTAGPEIYQVVLRYCRGVDRMERRDGRWAIAERWAIREWTRCDAGRFMPKEGSGPTGTRDHTDPLHAALSWL
jgi:hypothetical protein